MKKALHIFIFLFSPFALYAQDSVSFPGRLSVRGYVKDLQIINFNNQFHKSVSSNLIHNRINLKWVSTTYTTVVAEFRNRIFWGEEVKLNPEFATMLRNRNERLDLQKTWIDDSALVFHTNIERLYFDYNSNKLHIRLGRQRINWGISTTWNPNDIYNTYNFLDFDFEERPGADGAKVQHRLSSTVNIEVAYANTGMKNGNIVAAKLSFNKWKYDFQAISGIYQNHPTAGIGWAGSIYNAGFKGEMQYFIRDRDSVSHFNLTLEGDYALKSGWYFNASFLFNNNGLSKQVSAWDSINLTISPENLMPTKWNAMITSVKEINPMLSVSANILYAPGTNLLLLFPSVSYSLTDDLDIGLFWQSFFFEINNRFTGTNHRCFLRIKWSY